MGDHATSQAGIGGLIGQSAPMHLLNDLIGKSAGALLRFWSLEIPEQEKNCSTKPYTSGDCDVEKAFAPVDCSALTPTLVESELFGHVKGAFTGADRSRRVCSRPAHEGTIFLDEIGELPTFLQAKLLRALQEKEEIRPVGSTERIQLTCGLSPQLIETSKQKSGRGRFGGTCISD